MAVSRPFVFGQFRLFEGREAYSLQGAEISNYFTELSRDVESACYGSYFLEFADYYSRENMDAGELLLLLYQSLRALLKPALPNTLVQLVFELRAMTISGEYTEHPPLPGQRFRCLCMGIYYFFPSGKSLYLCADTGGGEGTEILRGQKQKAVY